MTNRQTEICYGTSYTISGKKQYENEKPLYSAKVLIDEENVNIQEEIAKLKTVIDPMMNAHIKASREDMSHLRIREKGGKKYPSVTTILNPDPFPATVSPEYGIRGTEIHNMFYDLFRDGEFREPKVELKELKYSQVKYKEWWEEFKERITFDKFPEPIVVYNEDPKMMYSGEIDWIANIDGKRCLCDLKTGSWKWIQLYLYWIALGDISVTHLCIWDLKKMKVELIEFGDPKITKEFHWWLQLRGAFRQRYGL